MEDQFISRLAKILPPQAIAASPAEIYPCLASPFSMAPPERLPLALLLPSHVDELAEIMRLCAANGVAMRFRGGGVSLYPLANPAQKPWVLIGSSKLAKISPIDGANARITVQAGVRTETLSATLAQNNLFLPGLDMHPSASIGGLLAENLAAPDFPARGTLSSRLLSLEVMTVNGEKLIVPGQAGTACDIMPEIPLAQIFCGSCGMFGLIYKASFQAQPKPPLTRTILLQGSSDKVIGSFAAIEELCSDGMLYLDESCAATLNLPRRDSLLLRFAGYECEARNKLERMLKIASQFAFSHVDYAKPWPLPLFIATALPFTRKCLWELTGAPDRFASMLEAGQEVAKRHGLAAQFFGYPNIARLNAIYAPADEADWEKTEQDLFALEMVYGNSPDLEEILDMDKLAWQKKYAPIKNSLRKLFDPDELLSEGDGEH